MLLFHQQPSQIQYIIHNSCFQWILVNVPQQGHEILKAVNRLTSKPVLKQMTTTLVFLVEIVGVCHADSLHNITDLLFLFP